ncbi:MAG: formate/nitrite transporter family protein [Acholeplasmataceae bacterium]
MVKETFLKAVLSGIVLGISGAVYLSVESQPLGALLFSFGLLLIVSKGYYLYTGKVGYLFPYQRGYGFMLFISLMGNLVGSGLIGLLFRFSAPDEIVQKSYLLSISKLDQMWYHTFILAILCGMMVYIAVQSYKALELSALRLIIVIMCVVIFILAGFEHSIANSVYLFVGNVWTIKSIFYLSLWIIGNGIGSIVLRWIENQAK